MLSKTSAVTAACVTAAVAVTLVAVSAAAWGAAAGGAARAPAKLEAPVITETFTPLPCAGKPNARDTQQQEGCAEQQILKTDAVINAIAKSIFDRLADAGAKGRFITAQEAWITYRRADCLSVSDVFEGGTQAPVLDAQCSASRNAQRITDLRTFLTDLGGGG